MTPEGVFFIYPNEDKLGFVNSANKCRITNLQRVEGNTTLSFTPLT